MNSIWICTIGNIAFIRLPSGSSRLPVKICYTVQNARNTCAMYRPVPDREVSISHPYACTGNPGIPSKLPTIDLVPFPVPVSVPGCIPFSPGGCRVSGTSQFPWEKAGVRWSSKAQLILGQRPACLVACIHPTLFPSRPYLDALCPGTGAHPFPRSSRSEGNVC